VKSTPEQQIVTTVAETATATIERNSFSAEYDVTTTTARLSLCGFSSEHGEKGEKERERERC
jgi:hypothetical protein